MKISISGILELQRKNIQIIQAMNPTSVFGQAIKQVMIFAHRYASEITPVKTGSLKGSQRMQMNAGQLRGEIFIDRSTRNPESNTPPYQYGVYVHRRGGRYAFYGRVLDEKVEYMGNMAGRIIIGGIQ